MTNTGQSLIRLTPTATLNTVVERQAVNWLAIQPSKRKPIVATSTASAQPQSSTDRFDIWALEFIAAKNCSYGCGCRHQRATLQ
ncbi:MAG: hypothetical protein ACJASX_003411 [Limisphaerales bacterium]|jgi:hypothetical protein